jgi:hypothetical protein
VFSFSSFSKTLQIQDAILLVKNSLLFILKIHFLRLRNRLRCKFYERELSEWEDDGTVEKGKAQKNEEPLCQRRLKSNRHISPQE